MATIDNPHHEPLAVTADTVCAHLRAIGSFKHDDGSGLVLVESLDGYALLDCVLPEHRLADLTLQCTGLATDGDALVCNGFMAEGNRLLSVTIAVRHSGACEIIDASYVGQILRPEKIEVVTARLFIASAPKVSD